jgi:Spy/CpxP family protein refolding chaperone
MKSGAKTAGLIIGVVLAAGIGCGIGCAVALKWSGSEDGIHTADHGRDHENHLEVHKRLELTDAQRPKMLGLEKEFAEKVAEYRKPIQEANRELADALLEDRSHSQRVKDAIDKIHVAQAELQKATIEHIIEMQTILDERQFNEFLELTAESLRKH